MGYPPAHDFTPMAQPPEAEGLGPGRRHLARDLRSIYVAGGSARHDMEWLFLTVKAPKPGPPKNLPPGTSQIGDAIDWFALSLEITGPDLIPEEITALLRREPDRARQKDKALYRADGTFMRVPTFGGWWAYLKREQTDEWDCAAAIDELLATMPRDRDVWLQIASRYRVAFRVGLSMPFSGAGFELPPELMAYLGERQIGAGFEVYSPEGKDEA